MKLILGSQSPRRRTLLSQAGLDYEIQIPDADEKQITSSDPETKVIETARLKSSVLKIDDDAVLLTCDTVVSHNNVIYEKPDTVDDARQMIRTLSGSTHEVYSGVILKSRDFEEIIMDRTEVTFFELSDEEIEAYIHTDEPYDKAGGYGIQSFGAVFVKEIKGDYNTVMGLPLSKVYRALKKYNL
ncbi:Septum formation protein Maf [Jeotgalicoccus saudimassiliensis]|uniref:dTTP/UTP pyrophosphatase n=1 Tax=Jeotgalicoccus saudimassiliensis TaxID=1461582 RepID=A0A078M945_9STAP|nr:Maf family protein [Jeotgalicoccus saudimassiliensis]CEA01171.1 Septum formation protein Maf [Jeotgalicoccus saudimassiliensis]